MTSTQPSTPTLAGVLEGAPAISFPRSCEKTVRELWDSLVLAVRDRHLDDLKPRTFAEAREMLALYQGLRKIYALDRDINCDAPDLVIPSREALSHFEALCGSLRPLTNPLTVEDDFL